MHLNICSRCKELTTFSGSADNLYKQFGHKSILTERSSQSGSKPFDTLIVFLKEFFEEVNFEKKSAYDCKSMKNYPACTELMTLVYL